jgi:hypothetical protein
VEVLVEHSIVFAAVAALAVGLFAASVVVVIVAERRSCRLALSCVSLLTLESTLLALSFGRVAAWMQAIDSLGVLLCLLALTLQFATPRPLSRWGEAEAAGGDPPWWPAFERSFRQYAAAPRLDPLRAAATRRPEDER